MWAVCLSKMHKTEGCSNNVQYSVRIKIVLAGSIVLTPRDHLIILSSCEYSQCPPLRGWWDFQLDRVLIGSSRGARAQSVRGNNLNNLYQTHTFPSQSNWIPGTFSSLIIWLRNGKFNIPTLMFIWYFLFWLWCTLRSNKGALDTLDAIQAL